MQIQSSLSSRRAGATTVIALATLLLTPSLGWAQANGHLQIHFIWVGQGDAALVISPLGETMLIDSGPASASACASSTGIITYLASIGLARLDYHVASHYDADHIGCTDTILARWPVQRVAYDRGTTNPPTTQTYTRYAAAVASKRQTAVRGGHIILDGTSGTPVVFDVVAVNGNGVPVGDENDRSVVLVLRYGQFDAEFGGDLAGASVSGRTDIESLIASDIGQVELYKVHHHGSATSSNAGFMAAIHPRVAMLSVGSPNAFDHPTSTALTNIHNSGAITYWTTAGDGAPAQPGVDVVVNGSIVVDVPPTTTAFSVLHNGTAEQYTSFGAPPPCSYGVSFPLTQAPSSGTISQASVSAPATCGWSAASNAAWLTITSGTSGTGNGTVGLSVQPNATFVSRTGSVTIAGQTFAVVQPPALFPRSGFVDFDRDGRGDISVYRHSTGGWFIATSGGDSRSVDWGAPNLGDTPVPADYDGDGRADIAVYRQTTGDWFIIRSSDNTLMQAKWGGPGDVPVPADYDGDGKADIGVFRVSTGEWFIIRSSNSTLLQVAWGASSLGDVPVPADYDGDRKADIGIYRLSTGEWFVIRSSNSTLLQVAWGAPGLGDVPVVGDYDHDGKADVAVFRQSTGQWFIIRSATSSLLQLSWGAPNLGDIPVPSDYDGDGKTDVAVFRSSTGEWFIVRSRDGTQLYQSWGAPGLGDMPLGYP